MGDFDIFCCICGGAPSNDVCVENEDNEDEIREYIDNKDLGWLKDVIVICEDHISKKGYYELGGVTSEDKNYDVGPFIWDENQKYYDNRYCNGFLVHSICFELMCTKIINFNNSIFFNIFKNKIKDKYNGLLDVIYETENNCDQFFMIYEKSDLIFLENPNEINLNINNSQKLINRDIYTIPNFLLIEIQELIFSYLDYKTLCKISNVCYYWYKLSINNKYWVNILKNDYNYYINVNNNIKEIFKNSYLNMKNRKRILKCIDSIRNIYNKEYI